MSVQSQSYAGEVAFISGGANGIGRATATVTASSVKNGCRETSISVSAMSHRDLTTLCGRLPMLPTAA
jgi:NAD(P)-dependent dehydrogenase (short-subunit alcohol dehydrogenase family)